MTGRSEAKTLGLKFYKSGKPCKHGHYADRYVSNTHCSSCQITRNKRAEPVRLRTNQLAWRQRNPGVAAARAKQWKQENPERSRVLSLASANRRRAKKLQATPVGFDAEITLIYGACQVGWTVDHDIPLQHPLVCGWHHPNNLRYMKPKENFSKGNTFDPERYPSQGQLAHQ